MTGTRPPAAAVINGISADDRTMIMGKLQDASQVRTFSGPWDVHASWLAGFASRASARGHEIRFDQPGDVAAADDHPTPHEYMLASVAGCLIAGVVMHATVQGVQLTALDVHVSGTFDNVLRWAGLDTTGNPGYRGADLRATISGDAEDDVLRDIWERALSGSPVAQTINRQTPVIAVVDVV